MTLTSGHAWDGIQLGTRVSDSLLVCVTEPAMITSLGWQSG